LLKTGVINFSKNVIIGYNRKRHNSRDVMHVLPTGEKPGMMIGEGKEKNGI